MFKVKKKSVVEWSLSILTSVMSISFLGLFFGIKESSNIDITGSFSIHAFNTKSIEYTHSNFEFFSRFRINVPNWNLISRNWSRMNFNPTFNNSLRNRGRRMIKLSKFDWFVLETLPFSGEESVFKIYGSCTNRVITENIIVIHYVNI